MYRKAPVLEGVENLHDPLTMNKRINELASLGDFEFIVKMGKEAAYEVMVRAEDRNNKSCQSDKAKDWLCDEAFKARMHWAELMHSLYDKLEAAEKRGHF
jgi:hypothetical protein